MVIVKAMKNGEAGVTPSVEMLIEMGAFNADLTPEHRAQWDRLRLDVEETT